MRCFATGGSGFIGLSLVQAMTGDILARAGTGSPITGSCFESMTTSNAALMETILPDFGVPPYTLQMWIEETVDWMRQYHPDLVKTSA